ncbi:MAG: hypothetical protein DCF23_12840 [Cyanobium sp.]|nr:MAG: hypothetical protein DCF23_12840 [Cyanobium sp.]
MVGQAEMGQGLEQTPGEWARWLKCPAVQTALVLIDRINNIANPVVKITTSTFRGDATLVAGDRYQGTEIGLRLQDLCSEW